MDVSNFIVPFECDAPSGEDKPFWSAVPQTFNPTRYGYVVVGVEYRPVMEGVEDLTVGVSYSLPSTEWIAALPLLNAWTDSPLSRSVLCESLHPSYWYATVTGRPFGTGETDCAYFARVIDSYSVPGAKDWRQIAWELWWAEDYPELRYKPDGVQTMMVRYNTIWDFRAVVLHRFFSQPAVVSKYGVLNWASLGGITSKMLEEDFKLAVDNYVEGMKISTQVAVWKQVVKGAIFAVAGMMIAGPLIAAAQAAIGAAAGTTLGTVVSKAVSFAVNRGIKEATAEFEGDPAEDFEKPLPPEVFLELAAQKPPDTAAMALPIAEQETYLLLDEVNQLALIGDEETAKTKFEAAKNQTAITLELAKIAGDDAAFLKLQNMIADTVRAISLSTAMPAGALPPPTTDLTTQLVPGGEQVAIPEKPASNWWLWALVAAGVLIASGKRKP